MQLEVKCGDHTVHAFANRQGSYISRHTGRKLKSLEIIFDALTDDQKEWATEIANDDAVVETLGAESAQWRIGKHDYAYTLGSPGARFTWELLEAEFVQANGLVIDGWELKPYKYEENFISDDALQIIARVEVTAEEKNRIRDMPEYFSVVRKGIQDEPREMRFGPCLWSPHGDRFRIGLRLIDKKYDEKNCSHGFNEPRETNLTGRTIRTSMELRRLLDLLVAKSVLSQTDVDQIRNLGETQVSREVWTRDYVKNLDEWLDQEGE